MHPEHQEDEIEIDLKELFFALLGRWKLIVLSTVLVAAIALCISKFAITPMYESTAELYVLSKSTSITSLTDLQIGSNLTSDYLEVAVVRPVIEEVIENLGLEDEETYYTLKDKITVTNPSDTRFLQITVTDEDNDRAKLIADEMANVVRAFIQEKMAQDAPNVITYGYADWKKVSPNVTKNTILGGLVGFVLAVVVVVLTYLLNDSLMTPEDMERKVGLNVLASLPLDEREDDTQTMAENKKRRKKRKAQEKKNTPRKQ